MATSGDTCCSSEGSAAETKAGPAVSFLYKCMNDDMEKVTIICDKLQTFFETTAMKMLDVSL